LTTFLALLDFLLLIALLLLVGRLVLDWVVLLARQWRPRGVLLVGSEVVFTATDPPLKAVRKVVPPLRIGPVQLDLAFLLVFLAVVVARSLV
jgi:YggT family protein